MINFSRAMGISFFLLPLIQVPTLDFGLILEIWIHIIQK
jgi:hypothetical protein